MWSVTLEHAIIPVGINPSARNTLVPQTNSLRYRIASLRLVLKKCYLIDIRLEIILPKLLLTRI